YFIILSMKEYKETQHSIHYKSLSDLSFYSAGYEKCKHSYSYGPKYRNYQLIHFVLSGEGTPHINEQTFNLKQGDAFLIPSGKISYYKASATNPWCYMD
ncbi:AraC family ligand binding domain-containing protein, partial [Megamonas funiformis]|uniref:AraC family ligand binding domain-containing protein n=1 Tax=Megamonas funiformis TaxID=437897 RepID=UPI0026773674